MEFFKNIYGIVLVVFEYIWAMMYSLLGVLNVFSPGGYWAAFGILAIISTTVFSVSSVMVTVITVFIMSIILTIVANKNCRPSEQGSFWDLSLIILLTTTVQMLAAVIFSFVILWSAPIDYKSIETSVKIENIKYIAENGKYILMDTDTSKVNDINMDVFYKFREQDCRIIEKVSIRRVPVTFQERYDKITTSEYTCVQEGIKGSTK